MLDAAGNVDVGDPVQRDAASRRAGRSRGCGRWRRRSRCREAASRRASSTRSGTSASVHFRVRPVEEAAIFSTASGTSARPARANVRDKLPGPRGCAAPAADGRTRFRRAARRRMLADQRRAEARRASRRCLAVPLDGRPRRAKPDPMRHDLTPRSPNSSMPREPHAGAISAITRRSQVGQAGDDRGDFRSPADADPAGERLPRLLVSQPPQPHHRSRPRHPRSWPPPPPRRRSCCCRPRRR